MREGSDTARLGNALTSVRLIAGDLATLARSGGASVLDGFEPEVCVHTAWHTAPADYLHSDENLALLAASTGLAVQLREAGCRRLVGTGTCFEYDLDHGYLSERTPT